MYISVSTLANAINNKQHLKTEDIIKSIHVMIIDNSRIHYMITDSVGKDTWYTEDNIPLSIVRLMNYNIPKKHFFRENKEIIVYHF